MMVWNVFSGDEMKVEDVASDRTADGGMSAGSDVETKDDIDMAEANGKIEDGKATKNSEPTKVKRKFLNRRERKSLPSKEEIAQKRYVLNNNFDTVLWRSISFDMFSRISLAEPHKEAAVIIHVDMFRYLV